MTTEDFKAWERGDTSTYAGFKVQPKLDLGRQDKPQDDNPKAHGWVVTGEHGCNVMPGCTWAKSKEEALTLIDVYAAVGGKPDFEWALTNEARDVGQRFWHLLRAVQRTAGKI